MNSKMIKSAFEIPDHVAIQIFVCAPPRCKCALNFGAGGDGFRHSVEKM
jgi:hypothetical protein